MRAWTVLCSPGWDMFSGIQPWYVERVNAGLRGHQFVKEGAEEVLECGEFRLMKRDL